jgi:magnesium transporter
MSRPGDPPGPRARGYPLRVTDSTATGPAAGTIRVAARIDDHVAEWADGQALDALGRGGPADPRRAGASVWIDLTDPDAGLVTRVGERIGLHPLVSEDIVEGGQRGKIEVTDGVVHVVLFALHADDRFTTHEVDLVLGDGFLLTAHPADWDPRRLHHLRGDVTPVLRAGPDHLLWAVMDGIVDEYFPFADRLEEVIDDLQDQVVSATDRATLERLFGLKRDLIHVRRAVSPIREVLNELTNRDLELIDPEEVLYFRDIYDHVIRLTDELDTDRELVAATVEIYLSTINNNLSVIMKRLTGVTVVLAGIGGIAGVFGMSEAGAAFRGAEALGFWLVAAVILIGAGVSLAILRRIDWI